MTVTIPATTAEAAELALVEMRTAAIILREVGLRSETTADGPFVAMDYVPKRPEPAP